MLEDAIGHGVRGKRSKSVAVGFDVLSMEAPMSRSGRESAVNKL
jgi:hypothetical protein